MILNKVKEIDNLNIDYVHLDIMDGKFVVNKTKGFKEIFDYVSNIEHKLDIHLMVKDVKKYIDKYALLNPEYITFHLEAVDNPNEIIDYIKSKNIKVGMSIKPNTDIEELGDYLNKIDLVLVMTVEPGKGGQYIINDCIEKVDELRLLKNAYNYKYLIEVDGGINDKTIEDCLNSDIVVVGSYITNSNNYKEKIDIIKSNF